MAVRFRIDRQNALVSSHFSGTVTLAEFANYARAFTRLPASPFPLVHYADGIRLKQASFSLDQMMPHAEQIVARLAAAGDFAAGILLAPTAEGVPFAQMFKEIAGATLPFEIFTNVDQALDRFSRLIAVPPPGRIALSPNSLETVAGSEK